MGLACAGNPSQFASDVLVGSQVFHDIHKKRAAKRSVYMSIVGALCVVILARKLFPGADYASLSAECAQTHAQFTRDHAALCEDVRVLQQKHGLAMPASRAVPPRAVMRTVVRGCGAVWGWLCENVMWFIRADIVNNVVYALTLPLLEPIQAYMSSYCSVPAQDIWFLREQVPHSRMSLVLINLDLSDFVHELKALEIELEAVKKLTEQDGGVAAEMWHEAYGRVYRRVVRIVGHVLYVEEQQRSAHLVVRILRESVQKAVASALDAWHSVFHEPYDIQTISQATAHFEQSLQSTLMLLRTVPEYCIHPWPPLICSEYLRLLVARMLQYGNPF